MSEPTTHTLDVPGSVLHYDIRPAEPTSKPVLLMVGFPMAAAGFTTLAGFFTDRTMITYDPRGSERSQFTGDATKSTPDENADDLARLIAATGDSPVDIFGSSGGAMDALALIARHHPDNVRTLVAHEPPIAEVLPDRENLLAAATDIHETYQRSGIGHAMAKFIMLTMHQGEVRDDYGDQPAPNPADFGMPADDDGSRDNPMVGASFVPRLSYAHDFDAIRTAPTRVVVAAGTESSEEMTGRCAAGVAERLGTPLVTFPSHHAGFLGGEYGQTGEPEAFAAKLREVLDGSL